MGEAMSKYPIGAAWEAVTLSGIRGRFYLEKRDGGIEVWKWEACYSDGSGTQADWGPSKRFVRSECAGAMYSMHSNGHLKAAEAINFKRVRIQ